MQDDATSVHAESHVLRWPREAALWAFVLLLPWHAFGGHRGFYHYDPPQFHGDGLDYENIAFHLSQGKGFWIDNQDATWHELGWGNFQPPRNLAATGRPPLYPLVIAGMYLIADRGPIAFALVRGFNYLCLAIAGAISAWLTARLLLLAFSNSQKPASLGLRKTLVSLGVALTILLQGTHNTLASYAGDFLTEPLALCLMQVFLLFLFLGLPKHRKSWLLAAGFTLGLMILCRSVFVVWLPGIFCLAYWSLRPRAGSSMQAVRRSGTLIGLALLVCLPWWIHNCVLLKTFMPLGTQGPITLIGGYSDAAQQAQGEWQMAPEQQLRAKLGALDSFMALPNDTEREVAVARAAKEQLWSWIGANWRAIPNMAWGRVVTHWNPYSGKSLLWKLAALLGLCFVVARVPSYRVWIVGLPVLSTLVVAGLYSVGGRFLVPLYGLLFTLASVGVAGILFEIIQTWPNRKPKTETP